MNRLTPKQRFQIVQIYFENNDSVRIAHPIRANNSTNHVLHHVYSKWRSHCFFKNDAGKNVADNGDRYRAMITYFFFFQLINHDVQELLLASKIVRFNVAKLFSCVIM